MTYIVSSGALNSTHSLTVVVTEGLHFNYGQYGYCMVFVVYLPVSCGSLWLNHKCERVVCCCLSVVSCRSVNTEHYVHLHL